MSVKCEECECFAYAKSVGECKVLSDTNFEGRKCPFFKTQKQLDEERAIYGNGREYNITHYSCYGDIYKMEF